MHTKLHTYDYHHHTIIFVPYRRALEAKAAIYARLSGGGGVREEEEDEGEGEEPRYMVDFTKKIWEEVNCKMHFWRCTANSLALVILNLCTCKSVGS
jgi:hypothetical protein